MRRIQPFLLLALLVTGMFSLAGCVNDTASYMVGNDRKHAVTLIRAQPWFWDDKVKVSIVVARHPDCLGGMDVEGVPRTARLAVYLAPDEYPERIFILDVEGAQYAISTASCRVQKFATPVAERGELLGNFQETSGKLVFVAAQ